MHLRKRILLLLLGLVLLTGCGKGRTAKETEELTFGIDVAR